MKKNNNKGFTLVELVIVIAVIAILAGVMISTFSNVVTDAQNAADLQEVRSQLDAAYINYVTEIGEPEYMSVDKTTYKITFYQKGDQVAEEKAKNLDFYSLSVSKDESLIIKTTVNPTACSLLGLRVVIPLIIQKLQMKSREHLKKHLLFPI